MMKIKTIGAMGLAVAMVGSAFAWSHSPSSQSFGTSGGSFTLAVSGSENYDWNAGSSESWITVSRLSATTFSVSVAANTGSDERRGNVTINAFQSDSTHSAQTWVSMQSCGITQAGTGSGSGGGTSGGDTPGQTIIGDVSPSSIDIGYEACTTSILIRVQGAWKINNDLDWVTVDRTEGSGQAEVAVTIAANALGRNRGGAILITDGDAYPTLRQTVILSQRHNDSCGIRNVKAAQRYPYSCKVDIEYDVFGNLPELAEASRCSASLDVKAIDLDSGCEYTAHTLSGDCSLAEGKHTIVWDMAADGVKVSSPNVAFTVACKTDTLQYCVIDVSGGSNASSYPVSFFSDKPEQEWSDDYKLTKIALRRIEPGTYHEVKYSVTNEITLTQPFYVSIYEMTQRQYQSITGNIGAPTSDSYTKRLWYPMFENDILHDDKCPAVCSYDTARGSERGAEWPASTAVDENSVIGKLRSRTRLDFDLPTSAQWGLAFTGGTTTPCYWSDWTYWGSSTSGKPVDYHNYAWGSGNSDTHTHEVGGKIPNAWGLYDMAGNVSEWCLDYYRNGLWDPFDSPSHFGSDPVGPNSTDYMRIARGGAFWDGQGEMDISIHGTAEKWECKDVGLRLSLTVPDFPITTPAASTEPIKIDTEEPKNAPIIASQLTDTIMHRIEMSWENDWPIHYTCDGTVPNADSTPYAGPIELFAKGDRTIKAIAISPEGEASEVATLEIPAAPTPTIEPADRTIISGKSVSVNISCSNSDATIYYTTDGSEPTTASSTYKRFKASTKMTIKAIAVVKDMAWSETATASYAFGTCADPVISPTDGTVFDHSNLSVSINWDSSTDGTLRYTTDGSEPTAASPAYTQPFAISETTTVKAKVFSDTYFDSAVVSATLTRVWNKVATPVISAPGVFSGSGAEVSITCATDGASVYYTTDGSEPNSHSKKYTAPFSVTATTRIRAIAIKSDWTKSDIADVTTSKEWSIGDSLGDSDRTFSTDATTGWVRDQTVSKDGYESMRSGAIGNSSGGYVESTISTVVSGKGTVSFWWKASCEEDEDYEWDHAEFRVNGEVVDGIMINGITDWRQATYTITTDGEHTLTWSFLKDDYDSEGEDCIWLDGVTWTAAEPQAPDHVTIPENVTGGKAVEIPLSWAQQFPGFTEKFGSDMAEAMLQPTKKRDGAGNELQVWHDYVAGTDPTDSNDVFRVTISIEDGVPVLSWQPDLNTNAIERTYQTYGRSTLSDETPWETPADTSRHHFFKVTVGMP